MRHFSLGIACVACFGVAVLAAPRPAHAQAAPSTYPAFTQGARSQPGLFTIWHKGGKVYLELTKGQLDMEYLETITTGSGLGGDVVWGDNDYLPSELVRFERHGDEIAIVWPNSYAVAPGDAASQSAIANNFPNSVVGVGAIVAEDPASGGVIFDASSLLGDQLDLHNIIDEGLPAQNQYRLDPGLSFFTSTKAFPQNDLIEVGQSWVTDAKHVIDTAPDARRLEIQVAYNFITLPNDDYRPRLADDRIGLYDDVYLQFNDYSRETAVRYIERWNFDPADPTRPSPARHPMVFYMSNTVPVQYRGAIADAVLAWNAAYARVGILDAIQVKPQPGDPTWDPDDVRYNVLRWLTEAQPSFGADSQTIVDPRTGEEIRTGVLISSTSGTSPVYQWRYLVDPVRYGRDSDPVPASFVHDAIFAEILHETGHNQGMQHNFIASQAYTAKELQSPTFTQNYGVAASAMEYAPINLWPRNYGHGTYFQTTLGPYDYYAIHWGYAYIPGANSPQAELPTLRKWASAWSDPRYRYASDEDMAWSAGHAADPRVEQEDLTDDTLAWCRVQMGMYRGLMDSLDSRLPKTGGAYELETQQFSRYLRGYDFCATVPAHWIGGQYLSRAHRGDPQAVAPIVPVPLATQKAALAMLDRYLFSDAAWHFSPTLLDRLTYSEWSGYGYTSWEGYGNLPQWAYNPPVRHDYPIVEAIGAQQMNAIRYLLMPTVLTRIDDDQLESVSPTLGIADLFASLQRSIYGDLQGRNLRSLSLLRRNLQHNYTDALVTLANQPAADTPPDAQAVARLELTDLAGTIRAALRRPGLDALTRAHLGALAHTVASALK
ncbi:MAG TPA: zinc-dependent metalloprotease [Candidatus Baltobacteraceae bacterium]